MAYDLQYYFDRGDQSADELLSGMMDRCEADVGATLVQLRRGSDWPQALDWLSGWVTCEGHETGIHVEIHADDELVNLAWESVAGSPGAPRRPAVLGACILTLSGEVDWDVFEALRTFLKSQWNAAEYDETDGFAEA